MSHCLDVGKFQIKAGVDEVYSKALRGYTCFLSYLRWWKRWGVLEGLFYNGKMRFIRFSLLWPTYHPNTSSLNITFKTDVSIYEFGEEKNIQSSLLDQSVMNILHSPKEDKHHVFHICFGNSVK